MRLGHISTLAIILLLAAPAAAYSAESGVAVIRADNIAPLPAPPQQPAAAAQTAAPAQAGVAVQAGASCSIILSAGEGHSIALAPDGTVWTWGWNGNGQLGFGSSQVINVIRPKQVPDLTDVAAIDGSKGSLSLALKNDGTVWQWGYGASSERVRPSAVSSLEGVGAISAGGAGRCVQCNYSIAIKSDGSVWIWRGQNAAEKIPSLGNINAIAAGKDHFLAIRKDGTVWQWSMAAQIKTGPVAAGLTPTQVAGLKSARDIAAGDGFSLALMDDGTVRAWGKNDSGQLGDGTKEAKAIPVEVKAMNAAGSMEPLRGVTAIAAGQASAIALTNAGSVFTWGRNSNGQLGIGNMTDQSVAVRIPQLEGVTAAIAAGGNHMLASRRDGVIMAWGRNSEYQLGNSNTVDSSLPVQVSLDPNPCTPKPQPQPQPPQQ